MQTLFYTVGANRKSHDTKGYLVYLDKMWREHDSWSSDQWMATPPTPLMTFCFAASALIWLARWRHRYATGTVDPILEQQCLNVTVVRGMKGKGITEEWYAAALLMCATHFHLRAPCGPETFLVSPSWPAVRPVCFLFSFWFCQITKFGPIECVKSHDCFLAIGSDIIAALASVQLYIQIFLELVPDEIWYLAW